MQDDSVVMSILGEIKKLALDIFLLKEERQHWHSTFPVFMLIRSSPVALDLSALLPVGPGS